MALVLPSASVAAADQPTGGTTSIQGAIWTTDAQCNEVNANVDYASRHDVYLDGGGSGQNKMADGAYWVKVTDPSGHPLGVSPTANVIVSEGKIAGCIQLWTHLKSASSGYTQWGYDSTGNNGGEYKVWLGTDKDFSCTKTDNFKVGATYELIVTKVDATSKLPMAGVGFKLKFGTWMSDEVFTDSAGQAKFVDLPGHRDAYTLIETTAPASYEKMADKDVFISKTACGDDHVCTLTVSDARLYKLVVTKTDKLTQDPMAGVSFTLTQGSWSSTKTTDADGKVWWGELKAGDYVLSETAPDGYAPVADKTINIPDVGCSSAAPFVCNFDRGNDREYAIKVTKIDATSEAKLAGVGFTLTKGEWSSDEQMTDADGDVTFGKLMAGTYTLTETTPPAGYEGAAPKTIVVGTDNENCTTKAPFVCSVTVKDARLYDLTITKRDADTEHVLPGAVFQLTMGDWSSDQMTTDANGKVTFTGLLKGSYKLVEITAPDGYVKAEDATIEIPNESCTTAVPFTCTKTVLDSKKVYELKIVKKDANTNLPMAGVGFTLYQGDAIAADQKLTDDAGSVEFHGLLAGEYTIVETKVPDGYKKAADKDVTVPVLCVLTNTIDNDLDCAVVILDATKPPATATPTESVHGETSSPTPAESVHGETGSPHTNTPPPTSGSAPTGGDANGGLRLMLFGLGVFMLALLVLVPTMPKRAER